MALAIGLLVAFGALMWRVHTVAFGEPAGSRAPVRASYLPMFAHLILVFAAGVFLPPVLVAWFQQVARGLG
jgi:hydrogenase-4 component F